MFDLVVPVHNGMHHARSCLRSLLSWADRPFHLYVVDDASDPYTATALRDLLSHYDPAHWTLLTNETNQGYLQSVNRGARAGSNPCIVFINSDTVTPEGALSKLDAAFAHDKRIGVVNAVSNWANWTRICWSIPEGHTIHSLARAVEQAGAGRYPDLGNASGFFFATRRDVFESVGGFDAAYGHGYWEEADYGMKALHQGWRVVVDDRLYIFHHGWGTFREAGRNAHMTQNRTIFMGRWRRQYKKLETRWKSANPLTYVGPEVLDGRVNEPEVLRHPLAQGRSESRATPESPVATAKSPRPVVSGESRRVIFLLSELLPTEKNLAIAQLVNELILRGFDANIAALGPVDESLYGAFPCLFRAFSAEAETLMRAAFSDGDVIIATDTATAPVAAALGNLPVALRVLYWPDYLASVEAGATTAPARIADWIVTGPLDGPAHAGRRVHPITLGVNRDIFHPQNSPREHEVLFLGGLISPPTVAATIRRVCQALHHRRPDLALASCGHQLSERAWPAPLHDFGTTVDAKAWAQAMNTSKVVVDLNREAPCPWRSLGAMACGAVVVVPPRGEQTTFAKHQFNALLADPEDIEEVVRHISMVLDDDALRQRLADQGMKTAQDYGLSNQCDRFIAMLAGLPAHP